MSAKLKALLVSLGLISFTALLMILTNGNNLGIFTPKGPIATEQLQLIKIAFGLMLIVVVPVFAMTAIFAIKYRETNRDVTYAPNWDKNSKLELIWWGLPLLIISTLGVIIWNSSHNLDPFKPLDSSKKPLEIQVIALNWKWLFIYPDQQVATVNYAIIPEDRPINFTITSDAPMNSFWIPQLGGQIYAMPGMSTKLHLMANEQGDYRGLSANLSGEGFSGMDFTVNATSDESFNVWAASAVKSKLILNAQEYEALTKPSKNNARSTYQLKQADLQNQVIMKYMGTMNHDANRSEETHSNHMEGM